MAKMRLKIAANLELAVFVCCAAASEFHANTCSNPPAPNKKSNQFSETHSQRFAKRFKLHPSDLPVACPKRHVFAALPLGLHDRPGSKLQQVADREGVYW
jgi:hypothetical protein